VHCLSFRLVEVKTFHMMVSVACLLMWLCVEHAYEGKVITRMLYNEEINNKLSKFIDIQDNIVICTCANYL